MGKLYLDKDEARFLDNTIATWEKDELINADTGARLRESYNVKHFDWHRLAQYSFWIAMTSGVVAITSLVFDKSIMKMLQRLYDTPNFLISILTGLCAAFFYYFGQRQRLRYPQRTLSNEAAITAGVLFTAISLTFLGKSIDNGSGHYSILIFLSVFIYGTLAVFFRSRLLWIFALASLGIWFATETTYQSKGSYYFWGMNFALRFVVFGALLAVFSRFQNKVKALAPYARLSFVISLFYFFSSLWMLSIFGNLGSIVEWDKHKQITLFYWAILSTLIALGFMLYGLKKKDSVCREFGIAFLLINLYSRYFEYFWNITDKAPFFGLLALSFWFIGRKAESIWQLNKE